MLAGIYDKREAARDAVEAIAVWLGDHDIPLTTACLFRCRILPPEEEWPIDDEWSHASSVLRNTVIESGPFMLDEWGDEDERFRKLRMYAAWSWYLSATGDEQIVAEAMVEGLYRKLFDVRNLTEAASKAALSTGARRAGMASHWETDPVKELVFKWLRENACKDESQASLVRRLWNLKPRIWRVQSTLKTWVREWHKSGR